MLNKFAPISYPKSSCCIHDCINDYCEKWTVGCPGRVWCVRFPQISILRNFLYLFSTISTASIYSIQAITIHSICVTEWTLSWPGDVSYDCVNSFQKISILRNSLHNYFFNFHKRLMPIHMTHNLFNLYDKLDSRVSRKYVISSVVSVLPANFFFEELLDAFPSNFPQKFILTVKLKDKYIFNRAI